jgi:DNA-binding SARP family transcriptional activator
MAAVRPALQIRLLGDPALLGADGAIKALERRAAGLLALVALEPGITRARAAALLWPGSDNARQALRQQLARFRRSYGVELVHGDDALIIAEGVAVDALQSAGGVLLGELSFDDCDEFAEWLARARRQRRSGATAQLAQRLAAAEAGADLDAAVQLAQQLLLVDDESEAHYRTLMRLHYLRGDIAQAQGVYQRLVQQLKQRFGAQPSSETEALARALRTALAAPLPSPPATRPVPVSVLRPPRMVGRSRERSSIEQLWSEGRAALLLGEPGMGKSRLLAELGRDWRAIGVQGRPGDAGVPYATLARLLRQVLSRCSVTLDPARRRELARLLPDLLPDLALPADGQRLALQTCIEHLLASAVLDGGAVEVIVIDDLHFADQATVEMLQGLVGALHEPLRFVLAQRPDEGSAATMALRDALEEGRLLTAVELAPLSQDEVAELIDSLQIADLQGGALAGALRQHCGGNPLFALETIKQGLVTGQLRAGQLPQPGSVGTLIERRLKQLSDKALALARVAAIAGPDFCTALAEHATGERVVTLADAWNELQAAQVLRDTAFAHDLVADAVLRSVPAPVARHLHAQVARWLTENGGEPARVAAQWDAAGESTAALPWLHRAADRALQALCPREAVTFLVRALDIEAELQPERAFETLARVVHLRLLTDQDHSVSPLLGRMEQIAATDAQRIVARLARADYCMHRSEHLADGLAAAQSALALALGVGDAARVIEAPSTIAVLQLMNGQHAEACRSAERFLPAVRQWPDIGDRCNMLGKAAFVFARTGRTLQAAELFDEAAREAAALPRVEVVALANAAHVRLQMNEPLAALQRLDRSDGLRAAHDELRGTGHSNAWMRIWAYQLLGRHGDALALFDELLHDLGQRSPGKVAGVLTDRARLWLDLGQWTRALQDRERALQQTGSPQASTALWLLDLRMAALAVHDSVPSRPASLNHYNAVAGALLESSLLPGEAGAERLAWGLDEAERCGYRGLQAAALARQAQQRLAAGDAGEAAALVRRSLLLADGRSTDDLSWPDLVTRVVPVLRAAGASAEAAQLMSSGARWIAQVATNLPAPLQPSLRDRHPVHRALLEAARRLD